MKKIVKSFQFVFLAIIFIISGCGTDKKDEAENNIIRNIKSKEELSDFTLDTILVYCPISMEKAVMEIKEIFEDETGCEVQVNVAEERYLNEEVKHKNGEVILSSDSEGKNDISNYIVKEKTIVGHIPVLAVKKGDFSGIDTLDGLLSNQVSFLMAYSSSSLGRVSEEFMKMYLEKYEYNYFDDIDESKMYSYLYDYDGYAAIIWKEGADKDKVDIIELEELKGFFRTIKASKLKYANNEKATNEFIAFLTSDDSKRIWEKYGYVVI